MNRRYFIKNILRASVAVGVVSMGAYILLKNGDNEEDCETFNACSKCSSVKNCDKPEAIEFKNNDARQ